MKTITLGSTGITTIQNAFGALPIQRVSIEEGIKIIQKAYYGGMRFFDTARAYSDSELKLGLAFENIDRKDIFIATKTCLLYTSPSPRDAHESRMPSCG